MANTALSSPIFVVDGRLSWRRILDAFEKVVLLAFYTYFLVPIVKAVWDHGDMAATLLAFSETLVVALVFFRRPAQILSQRPGDWLLAFGATLAPTLVRPVASEPSLWTSLAVLVMLSGILLQIGSKWMLGRRFGVVAAHRGLCSSGPYRLVRHPIYLGYLMTHLGFLCVCPSVWNATVYALAYCLMIPRIFAEESLLKRDPEYVAYCRRVRWRLVPRLL
ncbi:MAG: methyltransferase family protein [Aureliella sp.]